MKYVILGNGIAGIQAAETIRAVDKDSDITIISKEKTVPYSRPLISYVVSGELHEEEIAIRPDDFYEKSNLSTYLGRSVESINIERKEVILESGESISWDRLLIATGANPRLLDVEGRGLKNIFTLRNIEDSKRIVRCCKNGVRKAIVLGGGLVGFKAAYGLLKRGLDVSVFITSPYPLSQVADKTSGEMIKKTLEDHGLKVEVGKSVKAFEGKTGKVVGALLNNGNSVECDLVIVGKGVEPAVSFLKNTGVEINRGVIVNQYLESSIPDIYAAGDVAEAQDAVRNEKRVNAIWPVAVEQGRIAAMNMLGLKTRYGGSLARNVIRIFDLDFMAGGIVNPPDDDRYEAVTVYEARERKYKKLVFEENCLVGMVLVNCVEQGGVLLSLISQKRNLGNIKKDIIEKDDYSSFAKCYQEL